ncbi:MAG: response regulator [Proteobacteria bacterium]|nr:response regulator [Pseudomonadota bacterium]MBU1610274.1 response regulator [Pseudomonadota bacterium]
MPETEFILLLVEDDEAHAELALLTLEKQKMIGKVFHSVDGEDALDFLHQRRKYTPETAPRPNLILLDLRLPKLDGLEVLAGIKNDKVLRRIPVVVLTTSAAERDIASAYDLGVNSYLTKPVGYEELERMLGDLGLYWCQWNQRTLVR